MASNKAETFDREPAEGPRTTPPPGREHDRPTEREEQDGRASRGTIPGKRPARKGDVESAYTPARDDDRDEKSAQNEHRPRRTTM